MKYSSRRRELKLMVQEGRNEWKNSVCKAHRRTKGGRARSTSGVEVTAASWSEAGDRSIVRERATPDTDKHPNQRVVELILGHSRRRSTNSLSGIIQCNALGPQRIKPSFSALSVCTPMGSNSTRQARLMWSRRDCSNQI